MASSKLRYCDANIFLDYLNESSDRLKTLDSFFDEIERNNERVVTSAISKVEVSYTAAEKKNKMLTDKELSKIDSLWDDYNFIEIVEFNDIIASIARDIIRDSFSNNRRIKPYDSVHLATAIWVKAKDFITYDAKLLNYNQHIDINISEPIITQNSLF